MYVEMKTRHLNKKETQEFYDVIVALCEREQVQIEEKGDVVYIKVCPQGTIKISEDEKGISISSSTRHAGPGYHAFVVDFVLDIQTELGKSFEIYDDLNYDQDGSFDRLVQIYEDEITYLKGLILNNKDIEYINTIYDETLFYPIPKEGYVATILGYLSKEQFEQMSEKDLMPYFYIWNDWDKDAHYYRQCGLYTYVKEGLSMYFNFSDWTNKFANEVCEYFEVAHSLDPYIPLPMEIYQNITKQLDRQPNLSECISMEQEIIPYKTNEVFHLYEDMQIVSDGAAIRSIDGVSQSLCLMAPYENHEKWHWLLQASHNPSICKYEVEDTLVQKKEEDHIVLEAKKGQGSATIYFHCVIQDEKDIKQISSYIEKSGWMPKIG